MIQGQSQNCGCAAQAKDQTFSKQVSGRVLVVTQRDTLVKLEASHFHKEAGSKHFQPLMAQRHAKSKGDGVQHQPTLSNGSPGGGSDWTGPTG